MGIISLYKETGFTSFGDIVKITGMQHKYFIELMEYLLDDDSFESKLTGELYAEILNLRLWYEEYLSEIGETKRDPERDPMNDIFGRIMGG